MSVEEQRRKVMELVDSVANESPVSAPSTFVQAKQLANEELDEIIAEMQALMKKFESSKVFEVFGKKYIETILSSKEQFATVLNKEISQEDFEKLSPENQSKVKRQQKKRRDLLQDIAKSYGLI